VEPGGLQGLTMPKSMKSASFALEGWKGHAGIMDGLNLYRIPGEHSGAGESLGGHVGAGDRIA
jgi:hypothetical protein